MSGTYMITWASKREDIEAEGWTLVKMYSLTGPHHPPSAIFKKKEADNNETKDSACTGGILYAGYVGSPIPRFGSSHVLDAERANP